MVCEVLTGLSTLPRSLHCLVSAVLDGFLLGCGGKFSHFSLLQLPSHEDGDIDEGELMRCSSYPQNAKSSPLPDRNESIAVYCCNRFKKTILHAAHQSPANVDQLNITEVQIEKKMLANPFEQSEPIEPLLWTSRTTGFTSRKSDLKRKFCSRRRLSTRTFVWIFANMRHFFRTSSPGLYENCNFRFAKRP